MIYHLFDQSYRQLVLQHTILQNSFVSILKEFTVNENTVSDSFYFCKEIKDQDSSLFVASFDIQSLITNISLDETISICVDRAFQSKRKVKGLLKQHFKQLLTLAVKSSCFVLNDIYYQQIDGVAMGSPLGPTFANLFLVYYEHKWLENCPLHFKPKFYRRYVDDIFLMFDKKNHVKKFLKYMKLVIARRHSAVYILTLTAIYQIRTKEV